MGHPTFTRLSSKFERNFVIHVSDFGRVRIALPRVVKFFVRTNVPVIKKIEFKKMELPKIKALDAELTEKMLARFKGERTGWVKVGEKEYFFPSRYVEQAEGFYKFKARPSDTWVLSYPRSGTTWTQELVWLLSNNLDYQSSKTRYLAERFPFLEYVSLNKVSSFKLIQIHSLHFKFKVQSSKLELDFEV